MSETGVKSDPEFCLVPTIDKTNSDEVFYKVLLRVWPGTEIFFTVGRKSLDIVGVPCIDADFALVCLMAEKSCRGGEFSNSPRFFCLNSNLYFAWHGSNKNDGPPEICTEDTLRFAIKSKNVFQPAARIRPIGFVLTIAIP